METVREIEPKIDALAVILKVPPSKRTHGVIHATLQRIAMWLVWNGPYLGKFGPKLFDFAMGQSGKLVPRRGPDHE